MIPIAPQPVSRFAAFRAHLLCPPRFLLGLLLGSALPLPAATVSSDSGLRDAIANAGDGDTITFAADITLVADLPVVQKSLTIDGAGHTLDGANVWRGFFFATWAAGTATFAPLSATVKDLTITHARARGGNGGPGGGGGLGAGGAIFVADQASVSLSNVSLRDNAAAGGNGGGLGGGESGGGGGLGGNGGVSFAGAGGGGGGLGSGADGGSATALAGLSGLALGSLSGGTGGASPGSAALGGPGGSDGGGGGSGALSILSPQVSIGGDGGGGGVGGVSADNARLGGGAGGFGGGGGGAAQSDDAFPLPAGGGGFGGGGGNMLLIPGNEVAGAGGFGGGGGATGIGLAPAGFGGGGGFESVRSTSGGGGAGLGGAIFVMQGGRLSVTGPLSINGNTVAAGAGMAGGSAFGGGLFFQGDNILTLAAQSGVTQAINDVIADQTGSGGTGGDAGALGLDLTGEGTVALAGVNTYTGATNLAAGRLRVAGSLAAASSVHIGLNATLSGTGLVNGLVTLAGILSTGDGQLTLGSLTWEGDGQLVETLGGGASPTILGALAKSGTGVFGIALSDGGVTPGQTYPLLTFGSVSGFTAADFTVDGIPGTVTLTSTALLFTVAPSLPVEHIGVAMSVARGKDRATFTITNTGTTTTSFRLLKSQQIANSYPGPKSAKPGRPAIDLTYTLGGVNITNALGHGTAAVSIPAGGTANMIVKAKARRPLAFKRTIKVLVRAVSAVDPSAAASVRTTLVLKPR